MSLFLDRDYYVNSNKESGLGRYDVIIEPKNKNNRGFILEFKVVKEEIDSQKADAALAQFPRARIGGHNQNHLAEIRASAAVVGEGGVIHDLQQNGEDILRTRAKA